MSGFSAAWLALRERYDHAARNRHVLGALTGAFCGAAAISVVDLACGTGSTFRAISAHLPPRQNWRLVDSDLGLLARAGAAARTCNVNMVTTPIDLARDLELAIDGPLDLVTTSALLDLVSIDWLDCLVVEAAARRLPVYAALTYDGRALVEPGEPLDAQVIAGVNAHQRTDKGFGPALGGTAARRAVERFEHFGYAVVQGASDWMLQPTDQAIQEALFAGWAELASTMGTFAPERIAAWLSRRRLHLAAGRSRLRVGHLDIFARPIGSR